MTTTQKLIGLILTILVAFGGGAAVGIWTANSIAARATIEAMAGAAEEIAKIEIKNTTIHQKIIERTKLEIIYADCKLDAEAFKLLKDLYK